MLLGILEFPLRLVHPLLCRSKCTLSPLDVGQRLPALAFPPLRLSARAPLGGLAGALSAKVAVPSLMYRLGGLAPGVPFTRGVPVWGDGWHGGEAGEELHTAGLRELLEDALL